MLWMQLQNARQDLPRAVTPTEEIEGRGERHEYIDLVVPQLTCCLEALDGLVQGADQQLTAAQ